MRKEQAAHCGRVLNALEFPQDASPGDSRGSGNLPMTGFVHIIYTGRVQGVGFRYQTLHIARGYDVAGFVRNLPDGRVELEAEGEPAELDAFAEALRIQMDGFIRGEERSSGQREPSFRGFDIR
jgi:acylphosphatase